MKSQYQSIPSVIPNEDEDKTTQNKTSTSAFAVIALIVFVFFTAFLSFRNNKYGKIQEALSNKTHWPNFLESRLTINTKRPTNTTEALELNWEKSGEPCVPSLGEPWLYKGERSIESSATLYFTPETASVPGALSAIEVDYYGYIEHKLIGSYFSVPKESKDGTYYSVAVALRNSDEQDLCSIDATLEVPEEKYMAIAPDMANIAIPLVNTSTNLIENWQEGSCINGMGFHWIRDVVGGRDLTYKAENTVPVIPMYDPLNGELSAIFFLATNQKQTWPDACSINPTPTCFAETNFWEPGPGLLQINKEPLFLCSNFCGNCEYTGSPDGYYTTMHWFFKDSNDIVCPKRRYCRSGDYPVTIP